MSIFYYKAKKKNGETILGQIDAQTKEQAIELISEKGLLPITIEEKHSTGNPPEVNRFGRIKLKDLNMFTRQLISLLNAGISLLRALEIIESQTPGPYFKSVIKHIIFKIREGKNFSESLTEFRNIFSPLYVTMVRAGEESGNLNSLLTNIARYQQRQQEINVKVRSALAYPCLMLVFGLGSVIFILMYVMPKISVLFTSVGQSLPLPTMIIIKVSEMVRNGWVWLVGVILGAIVLNKIIAQSQKGRSIFSHFKLNVPILGELILKVELARFCRTFQLLLSAGIPILRSFQITLPILKNDLIKEYLSRCQDALSSGHSLGETLKQFPVIPAMMGHLIAVGEETGSLADSLSEVANTYEEETDEVIKLLTTFLEPLLIILVGSVIVFIVIAMLLPIFQLDVLV